MDVLSTLTVIAFLQKEFWNSRNPLCFREVLIMRIISESKGYSFCFTRLHHRKRQDTAAVSCKNCWIYTVCCWNGFLFPLRQIPTELSVQQYYSTAGREWITGHAGISYRAERFIFWLSADCMWECLPEFFFSFLRFYHSVSAVWSYRFLLLSMRWALECKNRHSGLWSCCPPSVLCVPSC